MTDLDAKLTIARDDVRRLAATLERLDQDDLTPSGVRSVQTDAPKVTGHGERKAPYEGDPEIRGDLQGALRHVYAAHQALSGLDCVPAHWWSPTPLTEAYSASCQVVKARLVVAMLQDLLGRAQKAQRAHDLTGNEISAALEACDEAIEARKPMLRYEPAEPAAEQWTCMTCGTNDRKHTRNECRECADYRRRHAKARIAA